MASQVAWLSFDAEQQRRTELMMLALADQGTIDELGMGLVRDLVARVLHPNLTVQHSRARYLVFLPRIYRSLTERTTEQLIREGRKREVELIRDLVAHYSSVGGVDDFGIVGRRKGEDAKLLASNNYWGLLQALGIETEGSVTGFCRNRAQAMADAHRKSLLHSDEEPEQHGEAILVELPADEGGPISFDLTRDEAEWVRQRFIEADGLGSRKSTEERSLVSWLLDPARDYWIEDLARPWQHPKRDAFPEATSRAMWVGHDVDRLVHGARILYNWLCAEGMTHGDRRNELMEKYSKGMAHWRDDVHRGGLPDPNRMAEIDQWMHARLDQLNTSQRTRQRWQLAYRFLRSWHRVVDRHDDLLASSEAQRVVRTREAQLKPGRARLMDPALLTDWDGDTGYGHLDFNWAVARRMLTDVHRGLGTKSVSFQDVS